MSKKTITFLFLIIAAAVSCIGADKFADVLLNQIGTLVILALLAWDLSRNLLSWTSFLSISIFCAFHILGARYLYSFVPYNEWCQSFFGWNLNAACGFTRNQYDRLVHFVFGILVFPCFMDLFMKKGNAGYRQAIFYSWLSIQSFSMLYELLEWLVALVLSKDHAENYNGQQGDVWDAHKDMALALAGSVIMYLYYALRKTPTPKPSGV